MKIATLALFLPLLLIAETDLKQLFSYDSKRPFEMKEIGRETRDGVAVRDITFAGTTGKPTAAYLIQGSGGKHPAILFLHWYEPESKDSDRTQFVDQAVALAKKGVTSLLIETIWSQRDWFPKRNRPDDFQNTAAQVREIRRALDLLLSQPGIDKSRVALVGHDFGGMFGAVLPSVDKRVTLYAIQAATPRWPDWYLYGPKMPEPQRTEFVKQLSELDPIRWIGKAAPAPVLFQFATKDRHVPEARGKEFFAAAGEPKEIKWYDAGHGLNEEAVKDRMAWIEKQFKLK